MEPLEPPLRGRHTLRYRVHQAIGFLKQPASSADFRKTVSLGQCRAVDRRIANAALKRAVTGLGKVGARKLLLLAPRLLVMVIPTGPNPTYDLAPTVRLLHGLRGEGIEAWRLGVVLSRFSADEEPRRKEEQFARAYLAEAGYGALEGCIRNTSVYSSALAEGYGLTEVSGAGRLLDEANRTMESISKGVAAAERRFQRLYSQLPGKDRDRGGRGQ
jgi:hypothetical protein